jgi:hypothetical protein
MIQVIDGLKPRDNGRFLDWKGAEQTWWHEEPHPRDQRR